jgi:hypothetical protein
MEYIFRDVEFKFHDVEYIFRGVEYIFHIMEYVFRPSQNNFSVGSALFCSRVRSVFATALPGRSDGSFGLKRRHF